MGGQHHGSRGAILKQLGRRSAHRLSSPRDKVTNPSHARARMATAGVSPGDFPQDRGRRPKVAVSEDLNSPLEVGPGLEGKESGVGSHRWASPRSHRRDPQSLRTQQGAWLPRRALLGLHPAPSGLTAPRQLQTTKKGAKLSGERGNENFKHQLGERGGNFRCPLQKAPRINSGPFHIRHIQRAFRNQ